MALNYNRKSASSDSRRVSPTSRNTSSSARLSAHVSKRGVSSGSLSASHTDSRAKAGYRAIAGGQMPPYTSSHMPPYTGPTGSFVTPSPTRGQPSSRQFSTKQSSTKQFSRGQSSTRPPVTSVRVGDIDRLQRTQRAKRTYHRYVMRIGILVGVVAVCVLGGLGLYFSDVATIKDISVKGVEHLTTLDMQNMIGTSTDTTLFRVDTADIKNKLLQNAWVKDVSIKRIFPDTLEVDVTERHIEAVVEIPQDNAQSTQVWAIASDGMWLMPIPAKNSEAGQKTSDKIYEDAERVLRITNVPFGVKPKIGSYCSDPHVNNALDIVAGMTTELADRVVVVSATEMESTTLTIKDGPDIMFGTAENIREKERVCLEIMKKYPEGVSYINVRTVDRPTWRAL